MKGGLKLRNDFSLKELRARINKTQTEVAKDLNISVQTYNSWENNPGKIKLSNLLKICTYYNVNISQIRI